MRGNLPNSITKLVQLRTLRLSANNRPLSLQESMRTELPADIGALVLLEELSLCVENVFGTLPPSIANLTRLREFSLISSSSFSHLTIEGNFPDGFYTLASLEVFQIRRTNLGGFHNFEIYFKWRSISTFIVSDCPNFALRADRLLLDSATVIKIRKCPLIYGTPALSYLPNIQHLEIHSSTLYAVLDNWFWKTAKSLVILDLQTRWFTGHIGSGIGGMTNLTMLLLNTPLLEGTIPPTIRYCNHLVSIIITSSRLSGPLPFLAMLPRLATIEISNSRGDGLGPLPSELASIPTLNHLKLQGSGLNGTIPTFPLGSALTWLDLSNNDLEGTIPALTCTLCVLSNNRLTGTVPKTTQPLFRLFLANNLLGPDLDPDIFSHHNLTIDLDLSNNRFHARLPEMPNVGAYQGSNLVVSNNRFFGEVPRSWHEYNIEAEHNELSGDLTPLFNGFIAEVIHLSHNKFSGFIPSISNMTRITDINLDHNRFDGAPPLIPPGLNVFSASSNSLNWPLTTLFIESVANSQIQALDLSDNQLVCPVGRGETLSSLFNSSLRLLNLARNEFVCSLPPVSELRHFAQVLSPSPLRALDLSSNVFQGTFKPAMFPNLVLLDLHDNRFTGILELSASIYPSITQIDISKNSFESDVSTFDNLIFLSSLNARDNMLTGSIVLTNMPKLETLDYSENWLNQPPALDSIGRHFSNHSLRVLTMTGNPNIPPFTSLNSNHTGLERTLLSSPATDLHGAICYSLTFHNKVGISFLFDEKLFSYKQCDCDTKHFGSPPDRCELCPSVVDPETGVLSGVEQCGGSSLIVRKNSFLALAENRSDTSNASGGSSASGSPTPPELLQFETESCLILPEQLLTRESNCNGLELTSAMLQNLSAIPEILAAQCAPGSVGRLCSDCLCHWRSEAPVCYYEKGQHCAKCKSVLKASEFIPLLIIGSVVIVSIGTLIMFIALRNKRVQRSTPWSEMPILKRAFHRFLYFLSLGHLSILVTFLQLFMELTHWDAYAIGRVLQLTNLNGESLGLRCLLPFLSEPVADLAAKLLLPFIVVLLIVTCVGFAELISMFISWFQSRRLAPSNGPLSQDKPLFKHAFTPLASMDDSQTLSGARKKNTDSPLVTSDWVTVSDVEEEVHKSYSVDYPTLALLTTVLISATRFLYFGTALAAHEYLFSVRDAYNGHYYIQNLPFIRVSDATMQRRLSIPVAVTFDFLLPAGFLCLCFCLRKTFYHKRTTYYLGSLFESFNSHCYWWEIVNIVKKLSIALVLRGVPPSNVLQVTLVVTIIAGIQVVQTSVSPWKRRSENIADALGSVILIGALLAARSGRYHNSTTSVYYVIAFATAYVVGVLGLIAYQVWTGTTDYQKRVQNLFSESREKAEEEEQGHENGSLLQSVSPWETEDETQVSNGNETDNSDFWPDADSIRHGIN